MALSDAERRKEEEELQMALALSVQDSKTGNDGTPVGRTRDDEDEGASSGAPAAAPAAQPSYQPVQGTTAATVSRVRAKYDFTPTEQGELAFRKGDVIAVLASVYKVWRIEHVPYQEQLLIILDRIGGKGHCAVRQAYFPSITWTSSRILRKKSYSETHRWRQKCLVKSRTWRSYLRC